jgi:uncharacterized protein
VRVTNRLAAETSPYLQQHKDNPVDWFPWGDEAFELARTEDKPVLLSIGYSACHWCHVMAHESFEDDATAAVMNELFVNVKVDREERPDVDAVYMDATQAMTGAGGWPMTVFLTPDGRPFFAGTYFPKQSMHGRPSFVDVLRAVSDAWVERRDEVVGQADELAAAVRARSDLGGGDGGELTGELVARAVELLRRAEDPVWGGFGRAPKFPQPSFLELLLRSGHVPRVTLDAMAAGGIYDHLGGGFARYSTDERWLAPHFEKMLYDNAQLLRLYVHAFQRTGDERYRQVVEEIVTYVERDLRSPGGGLYSAEDADSEGVEGKFYVWSVDEVREVGGDAAVDWYGVTEAGNWEGTNILWRGHDSSREIRRSADLEQARQRLFDRRSSRVRPGLDDKVLTEWNAMFVSAWSEAGAALQRPEWVREAARTAEFLLAQLRREDGRWLRSWQQGRAQHLAYASDHAWLVDAFTHLAEASGRARWVHEAVTAADQLLELFWDDDDGGLFTTGHDAERLIVRQKETYDGATPSANGVAAMALVRLSALTGVNRYREHADAIVRRLAPAMEQSPAAFTYSLAAVDLLLQGVTEVVVAGDRPDLVAAVHQRHLPNVVLAWGERFDSPLWEGRDDDRAYVCEGYVCRAPVTDVERLVAQLGGG